MAHEFARWLVNLLAAEVVQPLAAQVINFACPDVSDVMSLAVEYSAGALESMRFSIVLAASSAARAALCLLVDRMRGRSDVVVLDNPISTSLRIASDSDGLSV